MALNYVGIYIRYSFLGKLKYPRNMGSVLSPLRVNEDFASREMRSCLKIASREKRQVLKVSDPIEGTFRRFPIGALQGPPII